MLQGCTRFSRAYRGSLHTLQARTARDAKKAMHLALHLVLEGHGHADDVTDSPASTPSVAPEQEQEEEEEDVEIDSPDDNTSAEGMVCMQHNGSACAFMQSALCSGNTTEVLPASGLLPHCSAVWTCSRALAKEKRGS